MPLPMANPHLRGPVFVHQIKFKDGFLSLNIENDIKSILEEAGSHLVDWDTDGTSLQQMIQEHPDNIFRIVQSLFWQFLVNCSWFPNDGVVLPSHVLDLLQSELTDAYSRLFVSCFIGQPRREISKLQRVFPFFCAETVRMLLQLKVKNYKQIMGSDQVYTDIICFVSGKFVKEISEQQALKLRNRFILNSNQINSMKMDPEFQKPAENKEKKNQKFAAQFPSQEQIQQKLVESVKNGIETFKEVRAEFSASLTTTPSVKRLFTCDDFENGIMRPLDDEYKRLFLKDSESKEPTTAVKVKPIPSAPKNAHDLTKTQLEQVKRKSKGLYWLMKSVSPKAVKQWEPRVPRQKVVISECSPALKAKFAIPNQKLRRSAVTIDPCQGSNSQAQIHKYVEQRIKAVKEK